MIPTPFFVNALLGSLDTISSTFISFVSNWLQAIDRAFAVDKTLYPCPVFGILGTVRRLVIRPGAIGDFLVSLPALECLRTDYLEVWVAAANVPLVRFASRVRSISSTGLDLLGISDPPTALLEQLSGFDSVVSWYGANRPDFRDLVGHLGLPFQFFPALPPESTDLHASDFYLAQVRQLCPCPSDGVPRIACPAVRREFAAIHPFSGSERKNWPLESFRRVARELQRTMPVRWCAGPHDPPLEDAVHFDDLYELACWLAGARLYLGNDSGITHLAAAVGVPVLAMFGPTDPKIWAPRGANVRVVRWHPKANSAIALQ
jgi:ADP-heptose:LPS heptosyltransferase